MLVLTTYYLLFLLTALLTTLITSTPTSDYLPDNLPPTTDSTFWKNVTFYDSTLDDTPGRAPSAFNAFYVCQTSAASPLRADAEACLQKLRAVTDSKTCIQNKNHWNWCETMVRHGSAAMDICGKWLWGQKPGCGQARQVYEKIFKDCGKWVNGANRVGGFFRVVPVGKIG